MRKSKKVVAVFQGEINDGLQDVVQCQNSIAYVTQLENVALSQDVLRSFIKSRAAGEISEEQFDLFYLNTILVTTGWNKNDDVFDRGEVWAARNTPVHKQFNLEHNQSKIIGHMTSAQPVTDLYEPISDVSASGNELPANLPDKFHILTGAVIYREWDDEKAQAEIDTIIEEIARDEWFVSMECLFKGFDYGVINSKGEASILERSDETSYLTKHLRAYGGSGEVEGFKLGRLLRNVTFSGKGLVRHPANPESTIINKNIKTFSNLVYVNINDIPHNTKGTEEMPQIEDKDNKNADWESKLAEANEKIADLMRKIGEHENSATAAKITHLEQELETRAGRVTSLEGDLATATQSLTATKAELDTALARVSTLETELGAIKAAEVIRVRTEQFIAATNAPAAEADKIVKLFSDKNDADFAAVIPMFSNNWPKQTASVNVTASVVEDVLEDVTEPTDKTTPVTVVETATDADQELTEAMTKMFAHVLYQSAK